MGRPERAVSHSGMAEVAQRGNSPYTPYDMLVRAKLAHAHAKFLLCASRSYYWVLLGDSAYILRRTREEKSIGLRPGTLRTPCPCTGTGWMRADGFLWSTGFPLFRAYFVFYVQNRDQVGNMMLQISGSKSKEPKKQDTCQMLFTGAARWKEQPGMRLALSLVTEHRQRAK